MNNKQDNDMNVYDFVCPILLFILCALDIHYTILIFLTLMFMFVEGFTRKEEKFKLSKKAKLTLNMICFSVICCLFLTFFFKAMFYIQIILPILLICCLFGHLLMNRKIKSYFTMVFNKSNSLITYDDYKDKYCEITRKIVQLKDKCDFLNNRINNSNDEKQKDLDSKLLSKIENTISKLEIQKSKILTVLNNYDIKKKLYNAKLEYYDTLKSLNNMNDDFDFTDIDNVFNDEEMDLKIKEEEAISESLKDIEKK